MIKSIALHALVGFTSFLSLPFLPSLDSILASAARFWLVPALLVAGVGTAVMARTARQGGPPRTPLERVVMI